MHRRLPTGPFGLLLNPLGDLPVADRFGLGDGVLVDQVEGERERFSLRS
jgi:hypothetical protein